MTILFLDIRELGGRFYFNISFGSSFIDIRNDETDNNEFYMYFETITIIFAFVEIWLLRKFKKSLDEEYFRYFYGEDARG